MESRGFGRYSETWAQCLTGRLCRSGTVLNF